MHIGLIIVFFLALFATISDADVGNWGLPKGAVSLDLVEVPPAEEPAGVVKEYCTRPDANGSYDFRIEAEDGSLLIAFGKICLTYLEVRHSSEEPNGSLVHQSTMQTNAEAVVWVSQIGSIQLSSGLIQNSVVWFETEMFRRENPDLTLVKFPSGAFGVNCTTRNLSKRNITSALGPIPPVLPNTHHQAKLWVSLSYYPNCN